MSVACGVRNTEGAAPACSLFDAEWWALAGGGGGFFRREYGAVMALAALLSRHDHGRWGRRGDTSHAAAADDARVDCCLPAFFAVLAHLAAPTCALNCVDGAARSGKALERSLIAAVLHGRTCCQQTLLRRHPHVDAVPLVYHACNAHGAASLLLLLRSSRVTGAELSRVRTPTRGTLLHRAIDNGRPDILRVLLRHGHRADVSDLSRVTAIAHAESRRDARAVGLLLAHGAPPTDALLALLRSIENGEVGANLAWHAALAAEIRRAPVRAALGFPALDDDDGDEVPP